MQCMLQSSSGGQKITSVLLLFSVLILVLRIEFRSQGLLPGAFTH